MSDLLYKELSYKIIGYIYEMYNEIGFGYQEKHYQRILEEIFREKRLDYKRELYGKLIYNEKIIARFYLDFLIEDKIIIELKVANDFYTRHICQVLTYLKVNNLKLGIIILITRNGIKSKRIANSRYSRNKISGGLYK